jgi:hypothetical protein
MFRLLGQKNISFGKGLSRIPLICGRVTDDITAFSLKFSYPKSAQNAVYYVHQPLLDNKG